MIRNEMISSCSRRQEIPAPIRTDTAPHPHLDIAHLELLGLEDSRPRWSTALADTEEHGWREEQRFANSEFQYLSNGLVGIPRLAVIGHRDASQEGFERLKPARGVKVVNDGYVGQLEELGREGQFLSGDDHPCGQVVPLADYGQ